VLAGGCHQIRAPRSAATLNVRDLPADLDALAALAASSFHPEDPVALENVMTICDRMLEIDPRSFVAAWQWARAAFWLADAAGDDHDRRAWFSERGARRAELAITISPGRVEGHYYRGVDLGYLARTRSLGAVELVQPMYREALAAIAVDERFDHAGPLRLLGGVLINAPGWPASVGDSDEGAERLARAVELAPEFPLNHLYYGEALLKVGKPADARTRLLEARRLLAGPEYSWMKPRVDPQIDALLERARARLGH